MIDDVDRRLVEWASGVLANVGQGQDQGPSTYNGQPATRKQVGNAQDTDGAKAQVVLDPPASRSGTRGVSIYLMEYVSDPPLRGAGRPPLQVRLSYLVTAWGEKPEDAHRLLGTLMFASMDNPPVEMEVDLTPVSAQVWAALGVAPQPSFVLLVPFKQERPLPPVKYVRKPLVVQAGSMVTVMGMVVGPGDVPLAGARVEIAGLNMYEQTDAHGRFSFRSAPGGTQPIRLRIAAKGRRMEYVVAGQASDPITIHFDSLDKEE